MYATEIPTAWQLWPLRGAEKQQQQQVRSRVHRTGAPQMVHQS